MRRQVSSRELQAKTDVELSTNLECILAGRSTRAGIVGAFAVAESDARESGASVQADRTVVAGSSLSGANVARSAVLGVVANIGAESEAGSSIDPIETALGAGYTHRSGANFVIGTLDRAFSARNTDSLATFEASRALLFTLRLAAAVAAKE